MEDFALKVQELARARSWTQARLIAEATSYDRPGLSHETVRNAVRGRRGQVPSAAVIEALAAALDVDPGEFAAYRLAKAREWADPKIAGPERAQAVADLVWTNRGELERPEDVAEEAARQREATPPAAAPPEPSTRKRARGA